jgi:hypothetical protein
MGLSAIVEKCFSATCVNLLFYCLSLYRVCKSHAPQKYNPFFFVVCRINHETNEGRISELVSRVFSCTTPPTPRWGAIRSLSVYTDRPDVTEMRKKMQSECDTVTPDTLRWMHVAVTFCVSKSLEVACFQSSTAM